MVRQRQPKSKHPLRVPSPLLARDLQRQQKQGDDAPPPWRAGGRAGWGGSLAPRGCHGFDTRPKSGAVCISALTQTPSAAEACVQRWQRREEFHMNEIKATEVCDFITLLPSPNGSCTARLWTKEGGTPVSGVGVLCTRRCWVLFMVPPKRRQTPTRKTTIWQGKEKNSLDCLSKAHFYCILYSNPKMMNLASSCSAPNCLMNLR